MANLKSIVKSVEFAHGVVRFPSRYAAREFIDEVLAQGLFYLDVSVYRILSCCSGRFHVVYFPEFGAFFAKDDLDFMKIFL